MMRALGAEVVLVAQAPGSRVGEVSGADLVLVEEEARRITAERGAFRADQFKLAGNLRSHYLGTGPEIWQQSDGSVDAFCDFVGSGGTYGGCAKFFKEQDPGIRCYVVEPKGAAAVAGKMINDPDHPIQGGGYSMGQLDHLEGVPVDGFLEVSGDQATECTRRLARDEGLFAGYSSGANLAAALQLLEGAERGRTIAILLCDSGLKYLSTDLWP
jgi:cysteine synthase A